MKNVSNPHANDREGIDLLAIAPHRDDAELTCGGTLAKAAAQGYRTAIIDLTQGEMGTRGSAETRAREADEAAKVLGLVTRVNAELPDAHIHNTDDARARLVGAIRRIRPRVVILPYTSVRHPDHHVTTELGRDACYLAGLAKYGDDQEPHRPFKIAYTVAYREDPIQPSFVIDISDHFDTKMRAIRCYASQFDHATTAGEIFPTGQPLYDLIETQSRHYGSLIRAPYGEPYFTWETVEVDDIMRLGVQSM